MQKYWQQTLSFLKDVRAELKKVSWPSREGVVSSTKVVIILSVMLGLYVGGLDAFFGRLIKMLMGMR